MVRVADQGKPQYVTFPGGKGKPKPKPKPKPKRSKEKTYMDSLTAAGRQLYAKLPTNVRAQLKTATVGESAKILRAHREVEQMGQKPRKRRSK